MDNNIEHTTGFTREVVPLTEEDKNEGVLKRFRYSHTIMFKDMAVYKKHLSNPKEFPNPFLPLICNCPYCSGIKLEDNY